MMNERIKEIALQAKITFTNYGSGDFLDEDDICRRRLEKFAELIVQECVNWIDGSPTTEEGTLILSKSFIIANLKQFFGVEE